MFFLATNHQFHQYYIYGEFSNCKVEKARMFNCMKWKTSHNESAKVGHAPFKITCFSRDHHTIYDMVWSNDIYDRRSC